MYNEDQLFSKWAAEMYDRDETGAEDVDFALYLIGLRPRRVLERVEFYKSLRSHLEEFQFTSRPQEPAVLHMGGVLSSVISIPIPERRDRFAFGDTLCLGGGTGLGVTIPLPEQRDGFDFQSTLAMGGGGGMQLSAPVPQEPDKLRFDGIFRVGGKPAVRTAVPIPEA